MLLMIPTFRMNLGQPAPAFPNRITARSFPTRHLSALVQRAVPVLRYPEKVIHPRWLTPIEATKRLVSAVLKASRRRKASRSAGRCVMCYRAILIGRILGRRAPATIFDRCRSRFVLEERRYPGSKWKVPWPFASTPGGSTA
jgi:hypothetical protein